MFKEFMQYRMRARHSPDLLHGAPPISTQSSRDSLYNRTKNWPDACFLRVSAWPPLHLLPPLGKGGVAAQMPEFPG
jgi:hypothetical protein